MFNQKTGGAYLLIFMGWLIYSTSYLGKVNFSANVTQIMDYYNVTKAEVGIIPTFLFFSYGIGQVVNGLLCRRYNMRWMIFTGLLTSSIVNLIIAVIWCAYTLYKHILTKKILKPKILTINIKNSRINI